MLCRGEHNVCSPRSTAGATPSNLLMAIIAASGLPTCVVLLDHLSRVLQNNNILTAQPFARPQDMNPSNVVTTKLTRIQDYILKRYDLELHAHLENFEIAPQIYGM